MRRRPRSPGLAVARNEATVEFPEGITFSLDAETTDPIANLELLYRPPGAGNLLRRVATI